MAQYNENDTPMRLADAIEAMGLEKTGITVNTLDLACRRGDLAYTKPGKARLVTRGDIREWLDRCRSAARARDSGLSRRQRTEVPFGSSRTKEGASVQDALRLMLQERRERYQATS